MTDGTEPVDSVITEPMDSSTPELDEKTQDTNSESGDDEVVVNLDEEDITTDADDVERKRQESLDGQVNSVIKQLESKKITKEDFTKLPDYIRKGVEEKNPNLFKDEPAQQPIDIEKIKEEIEKNLTDKQKYKELCAMIPEKLPRAQNEILMTTKKELEAQGVPKSRALELAMADAGVKFIGEIEEARKQGARLAGGMLPPVGTAKRSETYKEKKAFEAEYEEARRASESTGMKLTREQFANAKKLGRI